MIRILVVDDHPAVRTGLVALLRGEPGMVPVAAVEDVAGALFEAQRHRPDVVLADYHLKGSDGLSLCLWLKGLPEPPSVLIYTAFAGDGLSLAAAVAGADGVVDKGAKADELFAALRTVAAGRSLLPRRPPAAGAAISARLEPEDLPVLGMRLEGTPLADIADVLGVSETAISEHLQSILQRLRGRERQGLHPS